MITKVFVMKYALTSGVFVIDAEVSDPRYEGYAIEVSADGSSLGARRGWFLPRDDYALGETEAREKFSKLKEAKVKSLEKNLKKIHGLDFKIGKKP
jgi:hypothetical protein